MIGDNSPSEFELTQDNFLDVLTKWMPDQLHNMRQYVSGTIKIDCGMESIECQYMQTVGGEKFRLVNQTPMGSSASVYFEPIGADDDIIVAFAGRIESRLKLENQFRSRMNPDKKASLNMVFMPGPFSAPRPGSRI